MYWELLSFYKLFPCTENFVNVYEFPSVLGTLNLYAFPPALKTLSFYFHLYWRLGFFIRFIFHVLGTYKPSSLYWNFVFLLIFPCIIIRTLFFTIFPMYWRLWGFTNFPSILRTWSFYWFHTALGTMRFYIFPCIENFVFSTIFPM